MSQLLHARCFVDYIASFHKFNSILGLTKNILKSVWRFRGHNYAMPLCHALLVCDWVITTKACAYFPLCVGFWYTLNLIELSFLRKINMSKNGIYLFSSISAVNLMLLFCVFKWCVKFPNSVVRMAVTQLKIIGVA